MVDNNLFAGIPANIPEEIFETLIQTDQVRIERIISKGQSSPETDWYDQEENEWVCVLRGQAKLRVVDKDGSETVTHLQAGNYLNIPAHQKHKVDWTDPEKETVWLAVFYN